MFCHKCGTKLSDEDSKFCHNCGAKSANSQSTNSQIYKKAEPTPNISNTPKLQDKKEGLSREDYLALTDIKSTNEAKKYLSNLKILFWSVFIGMIIVRGGLVSDSDFFVLLWLAYLVLLIYFVVYCRKVVKLEKISNAWWPLSFLFAPISWIWFYPEIAEPLKIIIGEKSPPKSFPLELTEEEKKKKEEDYKKWQKKMLLILGIIVGAIILLCIILVVTIK